MTNAPSTSSWALGAPTHRPGPGPGAGTTNSERPGSGTTNDASSMFRTLARPCSSRHGRSQPPRCLAWRIRAPSPSSCCGVALLGERRQQVLLLVGDVLLRRAPAASRTRRRAAGPSSVVMWSICFFTAECACADRSIDAGVAEHVAGERVERGVLGVVVRRQRVDDLADDRAVAASRRTSANSSSTVRWSARMRSIPFGMSDLLLRASAGRVGCTPARSQWRCTARPATTALANALLASVGDDDAGAVGVDAGVGQQLGCRRPTPRSA